MKQELELDFQAKLLNKEREWSRKLGDREKQMSELTESNKAYKTANDDMRSVVLYDTKIMISVSILFNFKFNYDLVLLIEMTIF